MESEPFMDQKIKIVKNGPYLVSGGVPLEEKVYTAKGHEMVYEEGRKLPQSETYALCRCGRSSNMPFCDGSHAAAHFDGTETAARADYVSQAHVIEGPDLVLTDEIELCAFARFCHKEHGSAWELIRVATDPETREEAIAAACDCPAGRLVMWDKKTGQSIEPEYEPSIVILQDPDRVCSGPIWVKGGIPIESSDGFTYEIRNRVTLCRCGESDNKPFCNAAHLPAQFHDGYPSK